MKAIFDCPGSETTHGYVTGPDGEIWYFEWDGESVAFRKDGTHTDHPIRTEGVHEGVRDFAETACELRKPNRDPSPDPVTDREAGEYAADRADQKALARAEKRRERYFDRHGHF